jgi:predicted RNase H-like HicB family nuclease
MYYVTVLALEDEGGYSVLFPDLPGCATQGETQTEAMAVAVEALSGHAAAIRERGEELPAPRGLQDVRADANWTEDYEINWQTVLAVLTPVDASLDGGA